MRIRVLIVDDHPVVRSGLVAMLASTGEEITVVGEASNGAEAIHSAAATQPDIILLDIRMPGTSGLDLIGSLCEIAPSARVVILTTYDHDEYLQAAFERGAHGFLLKTASKDQTLATIAAVHRGERTVDPSLVPRMLDRFVSLADVGSRESVSVSPDEMELLRDLAQGATNRELAARHHWSEMTIKRHLAGLFRKLGVADRTSAVAQAAKRGLI